ncbi:Jag family protein [Jatrophihabitans fulvus]
MSDTDVQTDTVTDETTDGTTDETTGTPAGETGDGPSGSDLLVQEGDIAADYLERLLDIVDYDGDIDLDVENGRAAVAIVGADLRGLVGPRGETLDALQELTRLAVQQQTGVRSRLMLDVGGHRAQRRDELQKLAADTSARVAESGEPARLSPMNPFERKVVHDAVAAIDGVTSESEGEEPNRRVVVTPAR